MSSSDVVPLLKEILTRISALETKVGNGSSSGPSSASSGSAEVPASVRGFDSYTASALDPFVAACTKLGGDAQLAGGVVKAAWLEMKKIIVMATACKEPSQAALMPLLAGVVAKIKEADSIIKRNEWEKHTKTVKEGISCLNWLVVKPAPRDFIESSVGGSDYWANGIRKEFRGVNADQIAFCDTFKSLLTELMAYVKEYHTTGLAWNNKTGVDVSQYSESAASTSAAPATPATPTVAAAKPAAATTAAAPAVKGDLFASLNKEGAITSGLKKVTKDMQTWRSEYKGGDGPVPEAKAAPKPAAASASAVKGTPKLEFQEGASKWLVEYQSGPVSIEIKDKKETVYVFGSVGATIDVKGKCKSIVVDGCKKVNVYFDSAFASCEVVNSQRMNIHIRDTVPSVAIDKTDGIVVHLPRNSLHTEIVASKSSEMNISWPDENGDVIERPIPEQYVHRIKGTSVTADVSDLYSH